MGQYSPTLASYLEPLPHGADSYPGTCVKASIVRDAIDDRPLPASVRLPAPVRALVDAPPPVSVWVPEVHFHIAMHAIRDEHFGGSSTAFLTWVYSRHRKFFSGALYRALFLVVSPERLLINMESRWSSFQRGSTLSHKRLGSKDVELSVTTPPYLYSVASLEGMSTTIQAVVDAAGAKKSSVNAAVASPTLNVLRVIWE